MIAGGGGVGAALMFAQRFFETPTVFFYILVMLTSGLVLDHALLAPHPEIGGGRLSCDLWIKRV